MERRNIIFISLAIASIILILLYIQGFFDKPKNTFVNPELTVRNNKIWTYLEKDYSGTDRVSLPYNNDKRDIPVFYKKCAKLMSKYNTIVVTPENINQYLSENELPFNNMYDSQLSFKNRSDIIGSALLYKYGGIFFERGTILMKDPKPLLQKLEIYDLITFGLARNPPNIPKRPYNHFNFGANFDGTRDHHNNFVDFNLLLGKGDIKYASPNSIYFISTPTDELYKVPVYSWFLKLSENQFDESDIYIAKTLNLKLKTL